MSGGSRPHTDVVARNYWDAFPGRTRNFGVPGSDTFRRHVAHGVDAVEAASEFGGVASFSSAAILHGWAVVSVPERPHLTFVKGRRLPARVRNAVELHWADASLLAGHPLLTSQVRTLTQCLRVLPEAEALALADAAARAGAFAALAAAGAATGPRSPRIRDIAGRATGEAANPFESVLRCLADRVKGADFRPQVLITTVEPWVRPDLVDPELRIVLEADSFEWHGSRAALRNDADRYNALVVDGWAVLRFSWEDVMLDRAKVTATISATVARVRAHTKGA